VQIERSGLQNEAGILPINAMWNWLLKFLSKFSVTAMLREQLSMSHAENKKLREDVASLKAELAIIQLNYDQTNQKYQRLNKEHEEEIYVWRTVEFRRGKRTFGNWAAFCPNCHMPINVSFNVGCSGNCGWKPEMNRDEISQTLEDLELQFG
jgi:hypothetical protein